MSHRIVARFAFIVIAVSALGSCETGPRKPKPVAPTAGVDSKPWNRPHSWENNARFGGMMPQNR
jgi:hypothetical protein